MVRSTDSATDVGDEAKMLAESGLEVYVGDRWESIKTIENSAIPLRPSGSGGQVSNLPRRSEAQTGQQPASAQRSADGSAIILDDGFQNPTIKKDISILVFDGKIGVGNGFVLPAGPLREPLWFGIARADALIIIDDSGGAEVIKSYARMLKKPVFLAQKSIVNPGLMGKVVPFAGIGYPAKFFDSVASLPKVRVIDSVSFPDHHVYQKKDFVDLFRLARKYGAELICTEKDWVKFPKNIKKKIKYMPLSVEIQSEFWRWLEKKGRK